MILSSSCCTVIRALGIAGAAISMLMFTVPARAAALSWNNAAGGSAATASNWNPVQIPTSVDDLTFNLGGSYSVTWNATVANSRTHTYRQGTVTHTISSPHTVSTGITVGNLAGDSATMTLTTGTLTSSTTVTAGNALNSFGTINVNDDDADLNITGAGADLFIGNNGDAELNITAAGSVVVADQFIAGLNAASSPTITVSGFSLIPIGQSSLEVQGTSQSRIGQGGDATMTVSNGASASFAGDLVIANGSASNSSITVQTSGILNATLDVSGDLLIGRNTSAAVAAGVGILSVNTGGTASVDGDTILGDPDGGSGTIFLNGGSFIGGQPVQMLSGSALTGTGTVDADVTVGPGSIVPTGASGLTFNGVISNAGAGVFGTKIHFGAGGGYTGSGVCDTEITGDSAAAITATGNLSIGKNSAAGFSYNGALAVGSQDVTLVDSNGAVLGGLTTIDSGGSLTCSTGIGLQLGGRIRGRGDLVGNVILSGILDPMRSPTPGGIISIQGNLTLNPSGSYEMDIGGTPASAQHDRTNVTGTASFNGTIRVFLPTGYVPKVGEQFIAINATAGRTGEFTTIIPPSPSPCNSVTFVMVYSSTAAIVLVRPPLGCTALGDLNSDGGCNGKDIQEFIDSMFFGPYNSCADMNGDCSNNLPDIPIFVNCLL